MNCPRCAADNQVDASVCVRCGSPLSVGASAPPAEYGQPGNPAAGYPQAGYPPAGYPQPGYPQPGYPPAGYGQPGYPPAGYPAGYGVPFVQTKTSGMAIAGFVLALLGCGLLGLIFSILGNNEVKRSNGTVTGGGLALAGIIISIIWLAFALFYVIVVVAAVGGGAHIG